MIGALFTTIVLASGPGSHVRVDGDGYLRFIRDGRVVYAREASLDVRGGKLCAATGEPSIPLVSVPATVSEVQVDLQGTVYAITSTGKSKVGRLVIALFTDPSTLTPDRGFYTSTVRPELMDPGEGIAGVIRTDQTDQPKREPAAIHTIERSKPASTAMPNPIVSTTDLSKGLTIAISGTAEVTSKKFTLGEIAKLDGDPKLVAAVQNVVLGDSPAMGIARGITREQIVTRLRMAGIKTENLVITVSGDAKVTPKGQKVENEAFVQKALEAMRAMNGSAIEYLPESQAPAMTLPTGTVELKSEGVGGTANRVVVSVGVYVDGRRYNSRTITLVPGAGTAQIKAGAMVKVIYHSNDVAITLTGRARRSGMTGETIEVQTDSGATVIGVVVDAGTVEVKL